MSHSGMNGFPGGRCNVVSHRRKKNVLKTEENPPNTQVGCGSRGVFVYTLQTENFPRVG